MNIIILGSHGCGKSLAIKLALEQLSDTDLFTADNIAPRSICYRLEPDIQFHMPPMDNSFRGGSRKKGGKTKYLRN